MVPGVPEAAAVFNRQEALDRFRRTRARTRAMFDLLDPAAYFHKPIALRNPIVFYEGHLPAFAVNTLMLVIFRETPPPRAVFGISTQ